MLRTLFNESSNLIYQLLKYASRLWWCIVMQKKVIAFFGGSPSSACSSFYPVSLWPNFKHMRCMLKCVENIPTNEYIKANKQHNDQSITWFKVSNTTYFIRVGIQTRFSLFFVEWLCNVLVKFIPNISWKFTKEHLLNKSKTGRERNIYRMQNRYCVFGTYSFTRSQLNIVTFFKLICK